MIQRIWILGAADPEMVAIESLLRECGETVAYAVRADGERVIPREAYAAIGFWGDDGELHTRGTDVIAVECAGDFGDVRLAIDHHRPGDAGYGRPPAEFLAASSLGQVIAELAHLGVLPGDSDISVFVAEGDFEHITVEDVASQGLSDDGDVPLVGWYVGQWRGDTESIDGWRISTDLVIAAACDHCLGAAWQGQCPGVSRDGVREYRARMASTRPIEPISGEEYMARFERTLAVIESGDVALVALGGEWDPSVVIDTRPLGHLDELPDVACYFGVAYLALTHTREGEPNKIVLGGCTTPQIVRAFMDRWAPEHGLTGVYGDPERGFAGGYLP